MQKRVELWAMMRGKPLIVRDMYQCGNESLEHAAGKQLAHTKRVLEGSYRIEKYVGGRSPDIEVANLQRAVFKRGSFLEFVYGNNTQQYLDITKHALRFGYQIFWVFHIDSEEKRQEARRELDSYITEEYAFGVYDPRKKVLDLGTPLYFDNFSYIVEGDCDDIDAELVPKYIGNKSMWDVVESDKGDYFMGRFLVDGEEMALFVRWDGEKFNVHPSKHGTLDKDDLLPIINRTEMLRLGPLGGKVPCR